MLSRNHGDTEQVSASVAETLRNNIKQSQTTPALKVLEMEDLAFKPTFASKPTGKL